tara:strand:+ start:3059 stop:3637 length:579 start_codon:yes stop_codon:yes gene_type:complete
MSKKFFGKKPTESHVTPTERSATTAAKAAPPAPKAEPVQVSAQVVAETNRIGDRLRGVGGKISGLLDLIETLKNYDLALLGLLIEKFQAIGNSRSVEDKIEAAIAALRVLTEITPTETDDKVVEFLDSIMTDAVKKILAALVGRYLAAADGKVSAASCRVEMQQAEVLGINWQLLMTLASIIADLIRRSQKG